MNTMNAAGELQLSAEAIQREAERLNAVILSLKKQIADEREKRLAVGRSSNAEEDIEAEVAELVAARTAELERRHAQRVSEIQRELQLEHERRTSALQVAYDCEKAEIEAALEEFHQLQDGTYFTTLNEAWRAEATHFTEDDCKALLRKKCPNGGDQYANTVKEAKKVGNVTADDESDVAHHSSSRSHHNPQGGAGPMDMFGKRDFTDQITHLVPVSTAQATVFEVAATWTLGLKDEDLIPKRLATALRREPDNKDISAAATEAILDAKQKAIHGSKPRRKWIPTGILRRPWERTGLKHSLSNKIRLRGHEQFLEGVPCVVIVPVMNVDSMKDWDGEGYDAIVMTEGWDGHDGKEPIPINLVNKSVGMDESGSLAEIDEIEMARELVTKVVRGLAYSLLQRDHSHLPADSLSMVENFRSQFSSVSDEQEVYVPSASGKRHLRVRKVTFGHGEGQDPPPDPLLLAVKSAVVWSTRNKQQLLPSGGQTGIILSDGQMEEERVEESCS